MTREKFIEVLDEEDYYYEIEGDKIVVTGKGVVDLSSLKTLPSGVEFKNGGGVDLVSLETLPPGVEFNNGLGVNLRSLKTLPPGVEFNNGGYVDLVSLETLPPGVVFNNGGYVDLVSLVGGMFDKWKGSIKGISPNRLLNKMIEDGLFNRRR